MLRKEWVEKEGASSEWGEKVLSRVLCALSVDKPRGDVSRHCVALGVWWSSGGFTFPLHALMVEEGEVWG